MEPKMSRDEAYKSAPEYIKNIYAGEDTGELLSNIAHQINLSDRSLYRTFALSIGDVILGLQPVSNIKAILMERLNMAESQAQTVVIGLQPLIKKLTSSPKQPLENIFVPKKPSGSFIATTASSDITTERTPKQTERAYTEKDLAVVKPLRTFAEDVEISRAHGYGAFRGSNSENKSDDEPIHRSSQNDLLRN